MQEEFTRIGRSMFIVAWLIVFALLFLFFYFYQGAEKPAYTLKGGQLVIPSDNQGHYRVSGYINEYPVNFIVDTGATIVAIPQTLADTLNLKGLYPVNMQTANGEITGYLTRLKKITFGTLEMQDVKAVIVPGKDNDEVLLGMNVLSNFSILQKDNRLIIERMDKNK